jgi:mRNA interferase MazF
MTRPHRGEVWWAHLPAPVGRRPVLILTRERAIASLSNVTVAPLTRTIRAIPTEVAVGPDQGLPSDCAVSLDNLLTLPKANLDSRLATLGNDIMNAVAEAIHEALDLPY